MSKAPNYKFCQMFGYKGSNEKVHEEDIISSVKFDCNGNYLALGDHAGRIIVFQPNKKSKNKVDLFDYYAEFQSHQKEFDPLRSQDVQETITDICWLKQQDKYRKLLTTNAKTIKLWKIFEKQQKKISKTQGNQFSVPILENSENAFIANVQTTFPSKHQSDIHSLSKSSNQEYILSFDDVQGFIWSTQKPDKPFVPIDYLKGKQIQDAEQNITCGKFHPSSDAIFAYGTNKRTLKMHDLRISSKQNEGSVNFKYVQKDAKNFFTDLVSNYTSLEFLKNGKYLAVRDFLSVKVWDLCQSKKPLLDVPLQQNYKQKLCQMYENDCIYDKFKLTASEDGSSILTGNYNNNFHVIDSNDGNNTQYELNYKRTTIARQIVPGKSSPLGKMDYDRKIRSLDFNQKKNCFVVASLNCFFIYSV